MSQETEAERVLGLLKEDCPAITKEHLMELYESRGFLVLLGEKSMSEKDARVVLVKTIEDVRAVCVNRKWINTKVLSWFEAFGRGGGGQ